MKHARHRLTALLSAAAVGCYALLGTGLPITAQETVQTDTAEDPLVPVVVMLRGEAVLAGEEAAAQGTDFINTPEAQQMEASLQDIQAQAESGLRALYPELSVKYRYTLLMNGFSCELPQSLIAEASALPLVESITPVKTRSIPVPSLNEAPSLSNAEAFREATDFYGEGEVICVMDTELDVTHPMFSAIDDKNVALTKADIQQLAGSLTSGADPAQAYLSSKLPYVYDYADDTPYDVSCPEEYHGTHVSGIAAGNLVTDENGLTFSGMAPDAQLVFMKVFAYYEEYEAYTIMSDVLAAALEDAVKLGVDVINMSFGSSTQYLDDMAYVPMMEAVENAGIIVCAAAGNEADRIEEDGGVNSPARIDYGTVIEPSIFPTAFSVASADNSYRVTNGFQLAENGMSIEYYDSSYNGFLDSFGGRTLDYVYCGVGRTSDFAGLDLTGRLALLDRGEIEFGEKAVNAAAAGAVGMIVCNNNNSELVWMDGVGEFPSLFISMADGDAMKNAADKRILVSEDGVQRVPVSSQISSFSSYGVGEALTLKPEIMGVGGNLQSAAAGGGYSQMSGTSMATPYVAGAMAVLEGGLGDRLTYTGKDKASFLRALMMNSARLYTDENGLYASPRRQGAGLVDLTNALGTSVLLCNDSGEAEVELFDHVGDSFDFTVSVVNIGDEDVDFTGARLVLTTDDAAEDPDSGMEIISGTQLLTSSADLSWMLHVPAGETLKETISVQLDAQQLAQIGETFTNGFYIEGYLLLEGADNTSDISIPLLGFHGDWASVPIFDTERTEYDCYPVLDCGMRSIRGDVEFGELMQAVDTYLDGLPASVRSTDSDTYISNVLNVLFEDDDAYYGFWDYRREGAYFSPNGDHVGDVLAMHMAVMREANIAGMYLVDSDGVWHGDLISDWWDAGYYTNWYTEPFVEDLPDGDYTAVFTGYINYPGAAENPQQYSFPLTLDRTNPAVTQEITEENGRTILTLTVQDASLDSVYVLGTGTGGEAERYDPAAAKNGADLYAALYIAQNYFNSYENVGFDTISPGMPLLKFLLGEGMYSEDAKHLADYSFSDILLPTPDEGGKSVIRYDITDLTHYTFTFMDKAYNMTTVSDTEMGFPGFRTGMWMSAGYNDVRYYHFDDVNSGTVIYQDSGAQETFEYRSEGIGNFFRYGTDSTMHIFEPYLLSDNAFRALWEDPETGELGAQRDIFMYLGDISPEQFSFYNSDQLRELAMAYYEANSGEKPNSVDVSYTEDGMATVWLYGIDEEYGDLYTLDGYSVSPLNAKGEALFSGNPVDLTHTGSYQKGDITMDDTVNAADATEILIAAAKLGAGDDAGLSAAQFDLADVNSDTLVNAADATIVLQYAAAAGAGVEGVSLENFI